MVIGLFIEKLYRDMKLQLNEHTLNAYINEAIRQELDENWITRTGQKVASKVGKGLKGAAKGTKNYVKALGGNKKSVKSLESELGKLKKELDDVVKQQKSLWGTENSGMAGHELVKKERGLRAAIQRGERALAQAKAGKTLARTATGTAAAGFGAGYLAGRTGRGGQNPDAPWNDGISDPGMDDGNQGNSGGNDGGFDGTFPWDNTEPQWAPPRQRKNTGTTSTNVDTGTSVQSTSQDSTQQKREIPGAIQPTTRQLNIPTGAVARTQETLPRPTDDAFHKNVARNMLNTASLSAGDASQREKNSAIRQIAKNGIAATRSQNYDGLNPKGDREFIRNARNTILRGNQNPNI